MSKNLQYKLNQFEVIPPASCWKGIAERLESEYIREDIDLAARLTAGTAPVPPAVWGNVTAALDADAQRETSIADEQSRHPVRRMVVMQRLAAVLILAVAVTLLYRYSTNTDNGQPQPAQMATTAPALPSAPPQAQDNSVPAEIAVTAPRPSTRPRNIIRTVSNNLPAPVYQEPAVEDMRYATIDNADKRITAYPISIPTEPIRDGDGNIILDEKLVSSPDNNYVTVTGPNGEQTRISKKFLRALSYMNAGTTEEEQMGVMLQESALWKWLFQEWRTRLIEESTFIPSSTNFLDILEMKDLLHDNL